MAVFPIVNYIICGSLDVAHFCYNGNVVLRRFPMCFLAPTDEYSTLFVSQGEHIEIVSPLRARQQKNRMKSNKLHKTVRCTSTWHAAHLAHCKAVQQR